MAVFGVNFKGADALMAVAEDGDVGVGAGIREATRARNEAKKKGNATEAPKKRGSFFKRRGADET